MEEEKLGFDSQKTQCLEVVEKNIDDMKRIFHKYFSDFNVNTVVTRLEYSTLRIKNCSTPEKLMIGWNEFSSLFSVYRILKSFEHAGAKDAATVCDAELKAYDKDTSNGKIAICHIIDALSNSTIIPELSSTILKFLEPIDEPYSRELNSTVSVSTKIVLADRAKAPRRG